MIASRAAELTGASLPNSTRNKRGGLSDIAHLCNLAALRAFPAQRVNQFIDRLARCLGVGFPKGPLAYCVLLGMVIPAKRCTIVIGRLEAHSAPAKDTNVRGLDRHSDATRNGALE